MKLILIFLIFSLSINQLYTQTKFAIIGDFGDAGPDEESVANLVNSWNVDFIITTGDNSYGSNPIDNNIGQYYSNWIGNYNGSYGSGSSINKFFPSLGNHDYRDGGGLNAYLNYFTLPGISSNSSGNERYYDYIIDNIHFFAINSNSEEPDGRSGSSVQANWLENEMTNSSAAWKIVYSHHPPYSSGDHGSSSYMRWNFLQWGADAVISGHDHDYERLEVDGLIYFVNGIGGRGIRNFGSTNSNSMFRYNGDFGAQKVTVSGNEMTFEFYNINGELIDSWTIQQSTPDITTPQLQAAVSNNPTEVVLSFSEILDPQSFQNVNNYSISNGISVIGTSPGSNNSQVTLTTSAHDTNQIYTVTVTNVTDLSGNVISPNNNSADYKLIILSSPVFPVDLFGTPESEKTITINLSLPGNMPDLLTYHLIVFDADHGGNDPPEGHAFINGNGPLELFPGATQANGDGQINSFAFTLPSSWWVNGANELKFVRLYSTGYRIDSAFISLDGTTDVQEEDNIPNDFTLAQNYPNPFNPSTSISFTLPVNSKVRLSVYNLLGEMIEELANDKFSAGTHTFSFNADGLTSGVYFYRLEAVEFIAIKKMILMK